MSREIKFRVWDKEEKEYYYNAEHAYDFFCSGRGCYAESFGDVLDQPKKFVVEQYTGLKDKNGKEIYEGDIIRDKPGYVYRVKWGRVMFLMSGLNSMVCFPLNDVSFNEKVEVIGNIQENGDLLGGKE